MARGRGDETGRIARAFYFAIFLLISKAFIKRKIRVNAPPLTLLTGGISDHTFAIVGPSGLICGTAEVRIGVPSPTLVRFLVQPIARYRPNFGQLWSFRLGVELECRLGWSRSFVAL